MDNTWISLHRKLLDWHWLKTPHMVFFFVYLLLKATHTKLKVPEPMFGLKLKAGQVVTTLNLLVRETGLSKKNIRTCLQKLEKTGEIAIETAQLFTLITISKYSAYQNKKIEGGTRVAHETAHETAHRKRQKASDIISTYNGTRNAVSTRNGTQDGTQNTEISGSYNIIMNNINKSNNNKREREDTANFLKLFLLLGLNIDNYSTCNSFKDKFISAQEYNLLIESNSIQEIINEINKIENFIDIEKNYKRFILSLTHFLNKSKEKLNGTTFAGIKSNSKGTGKELVGGNAGTGTSFGITSETGGNQGIVEKRKIPPPKRIQW